MKAALEENGRNFKTVITSSKPNYYGNSLYVGKNQYEWSNLVRWIDRGNGVLIGNQNMGKKRKYPKTLARRIAEDSDKEDEYEQQGFGLGFNGAIDGGFEAIDHEIDEFMVRKVKSKKFYRNNKQKADFFKKA
mmetsp:Transcript_2965/g.2554  ORF Transcript_2965/g.2554 Transcript_2965/m.2554 type:complete len:133 (-) Transcript_2965:336-734(-)